MIEYYKNHIWYFHKYFSLRKKCPYSELFWSVFFPHSVRIRTECGKKTDQNNSEYGHFSRSVLCMLYYLIPLDIYVITYNYIYSNYSYRCMLLLYYISLYFMLYLYSLNICDMMYIYYMTYMLKMQLDLRIHWRLIFGNVIQCSRLQLWVRYFIYFKFKAVFF